MVDGLLVAFAAFGIGGFVFAMGILVARSGKPKTSTFPFNHVSFDRATSDEQRLSLLDEARQAVLDGRLSQSNQLQDYRSTDKAPQPRSNFED